MPRPTIVPIGVLVSKTTDDIAIALAFELKLPVLSRALSTPKTQGIFTASRRMVLLHSTTPPVCFRFPMRFVESLARYGFAMAAILLCASVTAESDIEVIDAPRPARPVTILAPAFPKGQALREGGVKVDVAGTVQANGQLKPTTISAPSGLESFAKAVADVLDVWRFEPAVDMANCVPTSQDVQIPVWFEGTEKDPQISVALPKTSAEPRRPSGVRPVRTPKTQYPIDMLKRGIEGRSKVLVKVAPNGDILSVQTWWGTAHGGFDYTARRSAALMVLAWNDPAPAEPMCLVKEFLFCLDRAAPYPYSECKK